MSTRKKSVAAKAEETTPAEALPQGGGAFYRKSDGTLVRDRDFEQAKPEEEAAPAFIAQEEGGENAGSESDGLGDGPAAEGENA